MTRVRLNMQRLKEAAEKAKIELSSSLQTDINLPYLTVDLSEPKHMNLKLSRVKFEQLVDELIMKTVAPCHKALQDAGVNKSDIGEVLLVGGMTRIPKIFSTVQEIFGKQPSRAVNPDEVVAVGAAVQGGVLAGDVPVFRLPSVSVYSTICGVCIKLWSKNSTMPSPKTIIFSTTVDRQSRAEIEIDVCQGEYEMASRRELLEKLEIIGIPPALRGVPVIKITFTAGGNDTIHVSARDNSTGNELTVIRCSGDLSKYEIENMVTKSECSLREQIKNQRTEAIIKDIEEVIEYVEELRYTIQNSSEMMKKLKQIISQNDVDPKEVYEATSELQQSYLKLLKIGYGKMNIHEMTDNSIYEENQVMKIYEEHQVMKSFLLGGEAGNHVTSRVRRTLAARAIARLKN